MKFATLFLVGSFKFNWQRKGEFEFIPSKMGYFKSKRERERDECTTWFFLRIYIKKWGLTLVEKKKLFINITTILNQRYRILLYFVNILLIFKIHNLNLTFFF